MRADGLHALFHASDMARQRAIAIQFLKQLKNRDLMEKYARIWVSDSEEALPTKARDLDGRPLNYLEQSWALEEVLAFFVRVGAHLKLHEEHLEIGSQRAADALAPFCWPYWGPGLLEFANACKKYHAKNDHFQPPYVIDELERVHRATQLAKTQARNSGQCCSQGAGAGADRLDYAQLLTTQAACSATADAHSGSQPQWCLWGANRLPPHA